MRLVEGTDELGEPSIYLTGDRQGVETLQECVTAYAMGALEVCDPKHRRDIPVLVGELYDSQRINGSYFPALAETIRDASLVVREDVLFDAVRQGRLGIGEFARERRLHAMPVDELFLSSEGLAAYLHIPDGDEPNGVDSTVHVKPFIWECGGITWESDAANGLIAPSDLETAHALGATHYGYQHEVVPKESGIGYHWLSDRRHLVLGTVAETEDFVPIATVFSSDHLNRRDLSAGEAR